jgi:hypothetical protein
MVRNYDPKSLLIYYRRVLALAGLGALVFYFPYVDVGENMGGILSGRDESCDILEACS